MCSNPYTHMVMGSHLGLTTVYSSVDAEAGVWEADTRELEEKAWRLRALADPVRLRILQLLGEGERCVSELTDLLWVSQPTVSIHLSKLVNAGLVKARKEGRRRYYSLLDPGVLELVEALGAGATPILSPPTPNVHT